MDGSRRTIGARAVRWGSGGPSAAHPFAQTSPLRLPLAPHSPHREAVRRLARRARRSITQSIDVDAMEAVWRRIRGQLRVTNGDEFERIALHYLRVIWPSMIQAPRLQRLDRFGVDLCEPGSDTHFHVVVQAKGFKVDEQLLESQVRDQILPSIQKYHDSPLTCDEYIILHNRDGANRQLANDITSALDQLIQNGKAKSARLWDLFAFVKEVRNHIDRRIREKLLERSRGILRQQEGFFHFGNLYVPDVPLNQTTWKPESPLLQDLDGRTFVETHAARLIASPRKVRYAILIGAFGIGKTTTVLRAADSKGLLIVYVPAHTIRREHGGQGTNYLLRNLNDELDLLDDLPADTSEVLGDVMGAVLGRVFRQPNDRFVLVIDGLDEHSFYGTPHGLRWLTNELAELRCPIVLTSRREHFLSLIGNYELATQYLSRKGGADRIVDILQLGAWSAVQARVLLEQAIKVTHQEDRAASIRQLLERLTSETSTLSARLLSHPLFLQLTLDLIVDGEQWLIDDEDRLMELWVRRKIQRDLTVPRLDQNIFLDAEYYTESMMLSMGRIASEMQTANGEEATPAETINAERVVAIVHEALSMLELDVSTILTTSLLIPASRRRGRVLDVKFFHRAFQEFFARRASNAVTYSPS